MRQALLFIALAFWTGGSAFASDGYKEAVKNAVQGFTLDEIIQWSNGQYQKRAMVGRYVRWGGSIIVGAALIAAGLDYYYQWLRRETGTSLDTWYAWPVKVKVGIGEYTVTKFASSCEYAYRWYYYSGTLPGGMVGGVNTVRAPCGSDPREMAKANAQARFGREGYQWVAPSRDLVTGVPPDRRSQFLSDLSWLQDVLVETGERPPLAQWLRQNPDAAEGVRRAVTAYVDANPPSSPANPYPGVRFDPVPNPNQWTDNPFTRPDIDTDGDGYPDWVEWYEANRRSVPWPDVINDPKVFPDPHADPDGDGWTTWQELGSGTNPYDPESQPRRRSAPSIDTDGDGWPDSDEIARRADPHDPNDRPYGLPYDLDVDGDGVPDWQEIESGADPYSADSRPEPKQEQWPGGPPAPGLREVEFPTREAEREPLPELARFLEPWQREVVERWRQAIQEFWERAQTRFPFALVSQWRNVLVQEGTAQCVFPVAIGPVQAVVEPCENPIFRMMEAFRPVLAGLLWVSFAMLLVRRGLDVQQ